MIEQSGPGRATRFIITAAAFVVILWGISLAQPVLISFLVACFLAVIGSVPVLWMERKGIPSVAAVLIVMASMVALLVGAGIVVGVSLNSFSEALPFYQSRIHDLLVGFKAMLAMRGITITDQVLLGYINPAAVMNMTAALFTALSSVLSNTLLILFTVTFILLEASTFPAKLRSVLDKPQADFPQFTRFVSDISHYVVIKTLLNLTGAVLITIWLSIVGVDFPVLWGFLAFLLHFIPGLGSILAAVPPVILAFIQLGGGSALLTAGGYVAIDSVLGNIVEPRIMGRRFGLSTLVVFVSLIFWGSLLGLVGALLSVPLTISLKLFCESNRDTRWLAVLLGSEASLRSEDQTVDSERESERGPP